MDLDAILTQFNALCVDDRIRLVLAIWDSIPEEARTRNLTDEQKAELDRRLTDLRANPQIGLTWDEIKAQVKGGR